MKAPTGFRAGGHALWRAITDEHGDLDPSQVAQLTEACRAKDRLDELDRVLRGDVESWGGALRQANDTANMMKQLLAALRLPDAVSGKRPQYRGPRGVQQPSVPGGQVSSLDRARAAKSS